MAVSEFIRGVRITRCQISDHLRVATDLGSMSDMGIIANHHLRSSSDDRGSILLVHSASALDLFKKISSNEPARIGNNLHFGWEEVAISFRLPQTHAGRYSSDK